VSLFIIVRKFEKDRDEVTLALSCLALVAALAGFLVNSYDKERFKAPRTISPEQQKRITEKMKEFAGQEYTGMIGAGVADDSRDLWSEIGLALDLAGWKNWCCVSRPVDSNRGHPVTIWPAALGGVHVFWPSVGMSEMGLPPEERDARAQRADRMIPAAEALAEALTTEGLPAFAGPIEEVPNHPVVVISIGPKPQQ
jgi:hypothetical protein